MSSTLSLLLTVLLPKGHVWHWDRQSGQKSLKPFHRNQPPEALGRGEFTPLCPSQMLRVKLRHSGPRGTALGGGTEKVLWAWGAASPETGEVWAVWAQKKSTCPCCEGRMPGELTGGGDVQAEFCRMAQPCEGAGGKASNTSPLHGGPEGRKAWPKQGDEDWAGTVSGHPQQDGLLGKTHPHQSPLPLQEGGNHPRLPGGVQCSRAGIGTEARGRS